MLIVEGNPIPEEQRDDNMEGRLVFEADDKVFLRKDSQTINDSMDSLNSSLYAMDESKKKSIAVKKSIKNYPKPKSVHTVEKKKTPNPNNPEGKDHHF